MEWVELRGMASNRHAYGEFRSILRNMKANPDKQGETYAFNLKSGCYEYMDHTVHYYTHKSER